MNDTSSLKSNFRIKIVNEDDHSIRFQIGSEKRWLEPNNGEWEVDIDSTEDSMKNCIAWFNGINQKPNSFNIWEEKNVKYMIRKNDGVYNANFDGTNEKCTMKFNIVSMLEHRLARLNVVSAYKVKIVNEDDHEIQFQIDRKKKWIHPNKEYEFDIDPSSTTGICKAWFNKSDKDPIKFYIWSEKDAKFMIRKDDGIYKANFDGTNEECAVKFKIEKMIAQRTDKLKCLSACKVVIKNDFNKKIVFEINGKKHQLSSKDVFDIDIDDNGAEFCKTAFKGLKGESMKFIVGGNAISDFKFYKFNGIFTVEPNILHKNAIVILNIVQEENNDYDFDGLCNDINASKIQSTDESDIQNNASTEINDNGKDSANENGQSIYVNHMESKQWIFLVGKDGSLNKCLGFLTKKRKLENSEKYEETEAKKPKIISATNFYCNNMSL